VEARCTNRADLMLFMTRRRHASLDKNPLDENHGYFNQINEIV